MWVFVIFIIFSTILCGVEENDEEKCVGINAQLNAVFDQHDLNNIVSMGSASGEFIFVMVRQAEFDQLTRKRGKRGSSLWKAKMVYTPMDIVNKEVVMDDEDVKAFGNKTKKDDTRLYEMSNVQKLRVVPLEKEEKELGVGVASLVFRPFKEEECSDPECPKLGHIHFFTVLFDESHINLRQSLPLNRRKQVVAYSYPFDHPMNVYDVHGAVVGEEAWKAENATSVILDVEELDNQIKLTLLNSTHLGVNRLQFCMLVLTQNSVKIVLYEWSDYTDPNALFQQKSSLMLVPNVRDVDYTSFWSMAQMTFDPDTNLLYAVLQVARNQSQAVEKETGVTLAFLEGQEVAPFLFVMGVGGNDTLEILTAVNCIDKSPKYSKGQKNVIPIESYANSIDFALGRVLIAGTTFPHAELIHGIRNSRDFSSGFYTLLTPTSSDSDSGDDEITFMVNTSFAIQADAIEFAKTNMDLGKKMSSHSELVLNSLSASFPIEGGVSSFVIGGSIFSWSAPFFHKGRSFLVETDTGTIRAGSVIGLDDSTTNVLKRIYRLENGKGKKYMYFDIHEAGETSDKIGNYNADLWQVDCTLPNKVLELVSKIIFFVLVGISMFLFVVATVFFSIKGIYQIKKRKQSEEKDPLLL